MRYPKRFLAIFLLACAGVFVWKGVLHNAFLYDDDTFVVLNDGIRALSPPAKFFSPSVTSNNPQMNGDVWRPLTTFSYALTYRLAGLDARFFHETNLGLHLLNALLAFWLAMILAREAAEGERGSPGARKVDEGAVLPACIAAFVFLLHPVQVETVAWVSQRSNELFLTFYLASFLLFIEGRNASRNSLLLASLAFFALALLSKEMAVSLPGALFGYLWLVRRRDIGASALESLPYVAVAALFVLARAHVLGHTAQTVYWAGGFVPQMLTMLKGFFYYARLMLLPYPLSAEYLFSVKTRFDAELAVYALVLGALAWLVWHDRKRQPLAAYGVFLFLASLGPVSNLIPIRTIINERFLYPGALGFGLVLASLLTHPKTRPALRWTAIALLAACYASISSARVGDWKDHWSFVTANLTTCPQSATMHYGMGRGFAARGMFAQAGREYELALRIDPAYAEALNDLGLIDAKEGKTEAAIARYRQSVQKRVDFADALANLGVAYLSRGLEQKRLGAGGHEEFIEAARALEKAVALKPENAQTRSNLAAAYAFSGRLEEAIRADRETLRSDPTLRKARSNLALFERLLRARRTADPPSVVGEVRSRFRDPDVLALLSGKPRFIASGVYYEASGNDEPREQAREALAARDGGALRYALGRHYSDGYQVRYGEAVVEARPIEPGPDPALFLEASAAEYRGAASGADVLFVPSDGAVETLYLIRDPKALSRLAYRLTLSGKAASARLDAKGRLEVRSGAGRVLLALSRPVAIEEDGRRSPGRYDFSAGTLTMELPAGLRYPVLIDPAWNAVGNMSSARDGQTATLLPNGLVLITGGRSATATFLKTADLYDPVAGTFAATGVMTSKRAYHSAVLLPTGNVLIAGGQSAAATFLKTAELYNPVTGAFTATTNSMAVNRSSFTATLLQTGEVLMAGGQTAAAAFSATADLYNISTGQFSATGAMHAARAGHVAVLMSTGTVLIAGGYSGAAYLAAAEIYDPIDGTFGTTGAMTAPRSGQSASLLPTDTVLVAGGYSAAGFLSTAELYTPASQSFATTGSMASARAYHGAAILPNGQALVAGGQNTATAFLSAAEVYNPATATFSTTGNMNSVRFFGTATLLPSGQVLLAGGRSAAATFVTSAELYDPNVGSFTATGSMTTGRSAQVSVLLPSGLVLVAGGCDAGCPDTLASAELYDPATGSFTATGTMVASHRDFLATLLPTGNVLVAGGYSGTYPACTNEAELYYPSAGTFATTGSMNSIRRQGTATLMLNDQVLMAGGFNGSGGGTPTSSAEIYNIAGGTFSVTGSMTTTRAYHTATYLNNAEVLVAGGTGGGGAYFSTAELYNPTTRTFTATGSMTTTREYHTATTLPNGLVLLAGGDAGGAPFSTAELYNPATGSFTATGSMTTARHIQTATLLPSGKVLIAGGDDGTNTLSTAEIYDPAIGSFVAATNSMTTAREYHTADLLTTGDVLLMGGNGASNAQSSAERVRYTEYDYLAYASVMQPVISDVVPLSTITFTVSGLNFTGFGEAASGGSRSSGGGSPRVYLQFMDSGDYGNMPSNSSIVNVSTSVYPLTATEWGAADNSITFTIPPTLRNGDYMLNFEANGVLSDSWIMTFGGPAVTASYTTMVGNASGWIWAVPTTTNTVPSGSPTNWIWRQWTPGSGRQVPQGSANSWTWGGE